MSSILCYFIPGWKVSAKIWRNIGIYIQKYVNVTQPVTFTEGLKRIRMWYWKLCGMLSVLPSAQ